MLLFGAIPLGVTFGLMWIVPDTSQLGLVVFYAATFMVFDTCYTAVHVGYNALTPVVTKDYDERSSLLGYRMFFGLTGSLGAIILATLLGEMFDSQQQFLIIGIGLGLFNIIPPLLVFAITKKYRSHREADLLPPLSSLIETVKNKAFQMVMGLYVFSWTTASIMAAVLIFFANYYLKVPDQANYYVLAARALPSCSSRSSSRWPSGSTNDGPSSSTVACGSSCCCFCSASNPSTPGWSMCSPVSPV